MGIGGDSGDRRRLHWTRGHAAGAAAGRDCGSGESLLQGGGGGFCYAAGCGAAEARHSDNLVEGATGKSERGACSGNDCGGAGESRAVKGDIAEERTGGGGEVENCRTSPGWRDMMWLAIRTRCGGRLA